MSSDSRCADRVEALVRGKGVVPCAKINAVLLILLREFDRSWASAARVERAVEHLMNRIDADGAE